MNRGGAYSSWRHGGGAMSVGGISLSSALHGGRAFDVRHDVPTHTAPPARQKPTTAQVSMTARRLRCRCRGRGLPAPAHELAPLCSVCSSPLCADAQVLGMVSLFDTAQQLPPVPSFGMPSGTPRLAPNATDTMRQLQMLQSQQVATRRSQDASLNTRACHSFFCAPRDSYPVGRCCVQEERMRQDQLRSRTEGAMLLQMENELKESKGEIERSQICFPI